MSRIRLLHLIRMRIRIRLFTLIRILTLLLIIVMHICNYWPSLWASTPPFEPLRLQCEPPLLHFELQDSDLTLMRIRVRLFTVMWIRVRLSKTIRIHAVSESATLYDIWINNYNCLFCFRVDATLAYWRGVYFVGHLSLPLIYLLSVAISFLIPRPTPTTPKQD